MLGTKLRRDLFVHKGPFLAVAILVFLGIAMYGASYDSYQNLNDSYAETHKILNFADYNFHGGPFTKTDEENVESVAGVKEADARIVTELPVTIPDGSKVAGRMVGVPSEGQPKINQLKIIDGDYLSVTNSNQILVEKHFYGDHQLSIGQKITILGESGPQEFTIAGEAISAEYIWPARSRQDILPSTDNFGVFFIGEEDVQNLLGAPLLNEIIVRFNPDIDTEKTVAEVSTVLGEERITDSFDKEKVPSNEALKQDLDGFRELSFMFPILFLAVASMSIYVSLSRLIHAQRPQIGVLRANGYSSLSILMHYVSFGAVVAILGSIPGVILGAILARGNTILYTSLLSIPIVKISFYPLTIAIGVVLAFFFALIAAFLPARAAIKIQPAQAMRGETPTGGGKSILEFLLPFVRWFSPAGKLPFRNITRNKRRSISTIVGVIFSFILIMVAWGMLDTINLLLDKQFNVVQKHDFVVGFNKPVEEEKIDQVKTISGVAKVEPAFIAPVTISANGEKYSTEFFALEENTQMHTFFNEEKQKVPPPTNGLYAGKALQTELGVGKGDKVEIFIPSLDTKFEGIVAEFLNEPMGTVVYGNYTEITRKIGISGLGVSSVFLTINTDDRKGMKKQLSDLEFVAIADDNKALLATIEEFMILFYAIVGVMLVFGGLMAAALMFNTMTVNITERTRELVTMLTIGYSRWKIILLILAENILLVTIALIPGLIIGYYVSSYFMEQFNSDIFTLDFQFKGTSFVIIIALIYLIGIISQIPALLTIRRFNLRKIIRERIS
jgi:putative ABC transport system permease protein